MLQQKFFSINLIICLLLSAILPNRTPECSVGKLHFEQQNINFDNKNLLLTPEKILNLHGNLLMEGTLKITFEGKGFYPVELDGYGVARATQWRVVPELPYLSPNLPQYYIENGSPVAYLKGSYPEIKVHGKLEKNITGNGVLHGVSSKINFAGKVEIKDGDITAVVKATNPLPEFIECWENEKIHWELTLNNKDIFLGTSQNTIYTVLQKPITPLIHTPLNIASIAGRGLKDTSEITKRIWQLFKNQEIFRARDKKHMTYYKLFEDKAPAELRRMLIAGSGQCVAWSYLLYFTLGSQGIHSQIILVVPPGKGRIYVKNWKFIEGNIFVNSGKNGRSETLANANDIQLIEKGNGQPYTRIWVSEPLQNDSISFDDLPGYKTGPNGLVDTKIDEKKATPTIAYKFGLPNQRVYVIKSPELIGQIKLGGDDTIVQQINSYFVLSGPNGIVETNMQEGFLKGKDGKPHPFISWIPRLGTGASQIKFTYAEPKVEPVPDVKGDDIKNDWWINSGRNGISETPGANYKMGKAYSVAVGPGPDGLINSNPGGDDSIIDLRDYMKNAPDDYTYIYPFNMWPVPGVSGQNNPDPPTDFPNHMIVKIGNKYYDPSYGTGPFDSQLDWEKASIVGVGQQMRDNNNQFVRFGNQIMFFVKPTQQNETVTKFMVALPPN